MPDKDDKERGGASDVPGAAAPAQPGAAAPDPRQAEAPGGAGEPSEEAGKGWLRSLADFGTVLGVAGIPEGALSDPASQGTESDAYDNRPEPESLHRPDEEGGGPPAGPEPPRRR